MGRSPAEERLDQRVERLERQNRWLVRGVAGLGFLLVLGATQCRPGNDLLQVRGLELVDEAGRVRIRMAMTEQGPELRLQDTAGVARARLVDDAEGTALYLVDATGTTRVGVAQFAHGGGGVALHGVGSRGATVLYMSGGVGSLRLFDSAGTVVHQFPALPPETAPR
ncbi:MAG: hypothetical protein KJZ47_07875 [Gemmatimonadales bacterium]|nr:hypothetical protein [Gemmatimonadales bacterium]